jgi:hypothetical protein
MVEPGSLMSVLPGVREEMAGTGLSCALTGTPGSRILDAGLGEEW